MISRTRHSWKALRRARSILQESIGTFDPKEGETVPASGTVPLTSGEFAYLDYNATAPLRPEAREAIAAALEAPGNSSSVHAYGHRARDHVDRAREQLASLIDCSPTEIIFTSGATEANNLAIHSLSARPGRAAVSAIEHPAVLAAADAFSTEAPPLRVDVEASGRVDLDALSESLQRHQVAYVSVMAANNETGVLNDVDRVCGIAEEFGVPVHTDATQLVGRAPMSFRELGVAMLSLSAHKFGGPQGVGALIVRRDWLARVRPLSHGGGQERGHRSGTTNVAGVCGLGAAAAASRQRMPLECQHVRELRDELELRLLRITGATLHGAEAPRLPGVTNISFESAPADAVMSAMPQVAVSHGSACAGGAPGPSYVLLAMGVPRDDAECAIRFSLGYATTKRDVAVAVTATEHAVQSVRELMTSHLTPSSPGVRA